MNLTDHAFQASELQTSELSQQHYAVHEAVLTMSARNATTVHSTVRMPRSSNATTVSCTAARNRDHAGVHPSPTPAPLARPTVVATRTSRPAANQTYSMGDDTP